MAPAVAGTDPGGHGNHGRLPPVRERDADSSGGHRRLGIQPTRAFEAGDPVSSRSAATRQESLWLLASSPSIEAGAELAGHLHRLLAVLEPATAALWELALPGDVWLDVTGDDTDR